MTEQARSKGAPVAKLDYLGSTRSGKDVFSQVLHGGKISLLVAFSAAMITTVIAVAVGISAGYFGGRVDEILMSFTNIVLVFPQLPLLIIIAAFVGQVGPLVIALIIGLSSWAWGARVIRSQTMAIRNKEFVLAAEVMGESKLRIIFVEILPNLVSIVVGGAMGTYYALIAEAGLSSLVWETQLLSPGAPCCSSSRTLHSLWELVGHGCSWCRNSDLRRRPSTFEYVYRSGIQPKLKTGGYIKTWRRMKADVEARRTAA